MGGLGASINLNVKFVGVDRMSVAFDWFGWMSRLPPPTSWMIMSPSVVNCGAVAFEARSAEIFVPLVAIKVLPAVNRLDCSPAGARLRITNEWSPSLPLGIYFRLPLIAGIPLLKGGDYPDERSRTSCANWRSSLALRSDTAQKFV